MEYQARFCWSSQGCHGCGNLKTLNWNFTFNKNIYFILKLKWQRFFPLILKPTNSAADKSENKTHCLCALGSRDRSISIWLTNYSRPLCVIRDLFDNPIMDLSWSKSPNPGLLACSMDGSVSYIEFDYKEIGYPLSKNERVINNFHIKI